MANWFLTNDVKDSAFQHYSICKASVVAALPDNISFEAGSVLPLGLSTAAMGVYPAGRLELPLPDATRPSTIDKVVLIWGGSSSTGSAAIQLAVASGATVIATASEKNYDFVRSLGAAAVFDYRKDTITEDLVQAIKDTPGDFVGALDAIAEEKTWRACADVVKGLGGGRVVSNLPVGFTNVPEGVEVVGGEYLSTMSFLLTIVILTGYSLRHCSPLQQQGDRRRSLGQVCPRSTQEWKLEACP